jgi:ankyrin repeat protein
MARTRGGRGPTGDMRDMAGPLLQIMTQDQNRRPGAGALNEAVDGKRLYATIREGWERDPAAGARRLLIVRTCANTSPDLVDRLESADALSRMQFELRYTKYLHLIGHCVELGAEAHDVLDVVLNEIGIAQLNEDPYHVLLREVAKKVLIKAVVSNQPQLVEKLMLAGAQLDLPDSSRSAVSEREPNAVDAALSLEDNTCLRMIIGNVSQTRVAVTLSGLFLSRFFVTTRTEKEIVDRFVDAGIVPLIYGIKHLALRISIWDDLLLRAHLDENYQTVMSDISERKLSPTVPSLAHLTASYGQKASQLSALLVKSMQSSSGFRLSGEPAELCRELMNALPDAPPTAELNALIGSDARLPAAHDFEESAHIIHGFQSALIKENRPLSDAFLAAGAADLLVLRACSIYAFNVYRLAVQFGASGHVGVIERLVEAGVECAPCVFESGKAMALLDFPGAKTDFRILQLMVERILDPLVVTRKYGNMLHWACAMGRSDIVELMIERVVDVNLPSPQGATPLAIAANMNFTPIARTLLDAGAEVDFCVDGRSPLFVALLPPLFPKGGAPPKDPLALMTGADRPNEDKSEIIGLLVQRGADPSRKTPTGQSLLDFAQNTAYNREIPKIRLLAKKFAHRKKDDESVREVTEADTKQAEEAAQALLAEEDSKPAVSKGSATAKTNKKKSKQKKREEKKRAGVDTDASLSHNDSVDEPPSRHDDAASSPLSDPPAGTREFVGDILEREISDPDAFDEITKRVDEEYEQWPDSDDEPLCDDDVPIDEDFDSLESPDGDSDPRELSRYDTITYINDGVVERLRKAHLQNMWDSMVASQGPGPATSQLRDSMARVGNTMMINDKFFNAARSGEMPWPESSFAQLCSVLNLEVRAALRRVCECA